MRTLYSAQFQVYPRQDSDDSDLFWRVLAEFNGWVKKRYSSQDIETSIPSNGQIIHPAQDHYIYGTYQNSPLERTKAELFRLRWQHPSDNDDTMRWTTEATIASLGSNVEVYLTIKLSSAKNILSPSRVNVGRPRVITNLLKKYPTKFGDSPIPLHSETITTTNLKSYVTGILRSNKRVLPIVLLSPNKDGEYHVPPNQMMNWLLGFAHVAALKDQETTDQWTETVGQHMACYNGAIRIYWPGWRPDNPSINHKLYLPWYLPTDHAEAPKIIFGLLARVSSFRLKEGETVSKVQSLFRQKERDKSEELKKQLEINKKKAVQTDNKEQEQFLEDFEKTLQENDLLNEEIKSLKEELATAKDNFEALCRSTGTESINAEDCGMPEEPREFLTVLEAAKAASQDFSGNLHFLDTAFVSAANSPFARPEEVYQHFKALNDLVAEWREKEGKLGRGWKDWFDEHGIADYKAQISQTTRGKYGDEYKFIYKGERKFFEPHFTLGSGDPNRCLSIHWYQDNDDLTVIIGHCGKHLRNTLS